SPVLPWVNDTTSSLPSPLKSPTAGTSPARENMSCHFTHAPNRVPSDNATSTSPVLPWVNDATSSLPSPLKSPTAGTSPARENMSCHFTHAPNRDPSDNATSTSPVVPCVNDAASSF